MHVLGALILALVLATLVVKLLYSTTVGHSLLDRIPDEAWDSAYRTVGIAPSTSVETRQDTEALALFIASVVTFSACGFLARILNSRR